LLDVSGFCVFAARSSLTMIAMPASSSASKLAKWMTFGGLDFAADLSTGVRDRNAG
jgi:hypothetical protein